MPKKDGAKLTGRVVYVVGSAAMPVMALGELIELLIDRGWRPAVILTPTAASWVDTEQLAAHTGYPVRVHPRLPHESNPFPAPDALVAAPVTFNTLNKWANGISDTTAHGNLNESIGLGLPTVAAPVINAKLRAHPAYRTSVQTLRGAGVTVLDPDHVTVRSAAGKVIRAQWNLVADAIDDAANSR